MDRAWFYDGDEAIWFAKQKALDSGDEVPVRQQDDGWSPSFELKVVKPGKAAYDLSKNPKHRRKESLGEFVERLKSTKPLKQVHADTRLPHAFDLFWDMKFGQDLFDAWPKMSAYDKQRAKSFLGEKGFEARMLKSNPRRSKRKNPTRRRASTKRILRAWMRATSGKGSMNLNRKAARRMGLKASMFIRKNGRRK